MHYNSLKYFTIVAGIVSLLSTNIALADLQQLTSPASSTPSGSPITKPSPLGCYDFTGNLNVGMKGIAVRHLQYFLLKEGLDIPQQEFGVFGVNTSNAVSAFQLKYATVILVPAGLTQGNGHVGKGTRAKLNSMYSCDVMPVTQVIQGYTDNINPLSALPSGSSIRLAITNTTLDSNNVTVTFCNKGTVDLPTAPFRIRLNGINRDFEVTGAKKAGACETDPIPYGTWGLTYDPGATFTAIGLIDPNGYYKTASTQYAVTATTSLSVPSVPGAHLSVRSVLIKTTGVQATLCNLGTADLNTFPISVAVNGIVRNFDVSTVYKKGICVPVSWTFDNWGLSYTPNTPYTATITTDPNNIIPEVDEFDNTATAIGTP